MESSKRRRRKLLRGHDNDQLPALQTRMRRARFSLGLLAAVAAFPIWETSAEDQKKQIFTWQQDRSRSGPILIIVNIDDQMAFVY